ncbi:hypothetical protein PGB90_006781 [Kerria lacca]
MPVKKFLKEVTIMALLSRICILILQFFFNVLIPNHQSDGFISPANYISKSKVDHIIELIFGGLVCWDAQYFLHISIYGYVYENTLAFFPGYPYCIKSVGFIIQILCQFGNILSIHLCCAVFLNILFFVLSARTLFRLTYKELRNEKIAYIACVLFCINPASIFFTAPYSETLFSYLTFNAMLHENVSSCCIYIALSAIVRSNGIINVGFPLYRELKRFLNKPSNCYNIILFSCNIFKIIICSLCLFITYQIYSYYQFCSFFNYLFDKNILKLAEEKSFILAGNNTSDMCKSFIPYLYVQSYYWNVGFLEYFKLKQLPNFILASPIFYFIAIQNTQYFLQKKHLIRTLGLIRTSKSEIDDHIIIYVIHSVVLLLVCLFFVHIQVTTRLLCSSSPIPYWFAAKLIYPDVNIELNFSFKRHYNFSLITHVIIFYCLLYCLIGTALFSNFYPWT